MREKGDVRAHLLFEALQQLGWDSNAESLIDRVRRLEIGLPAEDELSVVLNWLGRSRLVHKLDQLQSPPGSRTEYRVPDLLAIFEYHGRAVPVLIEVKTSDEATLSWRPDYRDALQRYADALRLPLLVAWRHRTFWVLFDAAHLSRAKSNFNVRFVDALKQTLMGELAGDFSFCFRPGVGLHLRIRKSAETPDGLRGVIEEVRWVNSAGETFEKVEGVFPLFLCLEQEPVVVETESHVEQSFIIPGSESAEFAHRALVSLLRFSTGTDEIEWRRVLEENRAPRIMEGGLRAAAQKALDAGFLQYGFDIQPATMPSFLARPAAG
jgi:Holliday junction resolvase